MSISIDPSKRCLERPDDGNSWIKRLPCLVIVRGVFGFLQDYKRACDGSSILLRSI